MLKNQDLSIDCVINLQYLGFLRVSGTDAKKLLQGQLTCHLEEITPTQTRWAAHCNPKGRIISFFHLFLYEDSYYLQMPRVLIPTALLALKKYAPFYKVEINDASDHLACIGFTEESIPQKIKDRHPACLIIHHDQRYQLIGEKSLIETLLQSFKFDTTDTYWHQLSIEAGLASIFPETSEQFLPHELNLTAFDAISFNKGCYTGQEIIARMHYRGSSKKQLQKIILTSETVPTRGADISEGQIVDFCPLTPNEYLVLIIG